MVAKDAKGILVALQMVPGLKAAQALTLCQLNRMGDVATVANDMLYMFLFSCSINDVNLALKHIFKLPVVDVVLQHQAWHQDELILHELQKIQHLQSSAWLAPKLVNQSPARATASERSPTDPSPTDRLKPHVFSLPLISEL